MKTTAFSQPLITWTASNWHGDFETEGASSFRIGWSAIVVGKKVEACQIFASRNGDRWLVRYEMAPDLPWQPWEIRKLIEAAEKKVSNHESSAAP